MRRRRTRVKGYHRPIHRPVRRFRAHQALGTVDPRGLQVLGIAAAGLVLIFLYGAWSGSASRS